MDVTDYMSAQDQSTATIGTENIVEACYTIAMIADTDNFVVSGNSDPGGLYGSDTIPTGFVMAMDYTSFAVHVGRSLDSNQVSYPVNMISHSDTSSLYIATLTSTSIEMSDDAQTLSQQLHLEPNWLRHRRYGTSFEMTLHKMGYNFDDNFDVGALIPSWTIYFPITVEENNDDDGVTKPNVYLGGMILKADTLIVAGSTSGKGDGYGDASGTDEDGFLSVLDPTTGTVIESDRIGTNQDDVLYGICHDVNDDSSIYIVGATQGSMSDSASNGDWQWQAFVQKKSMTNLFGGVLWSVQWDDNDSTTTTTTTLFPSRKVKAVECLVDGDVLYVAGTSNPSAEVDGTDTANGFDDIFVAQLNVLDGTINWVTAIATAGEEYLADGGALTLDENKNLVVYGTTNGSLYRSKDSSETTWDVFVVTVDRTDGTIAPSPSEGGGSGGSSGTELPSAAHGLLEAIQTGPSVGSVLAGGMVYEANEDRIFLTGSTYDPQFQNGSTAASSKPFGYYASVNLIDGTVQKWGANAVYGDPNHQETFTSLVLLGNIDVVIVGAAGPGSSLLSDSTPGGVAIGVDRNFERHPYKIHEEFYTKGRYGAEGTYRFPVSITSSGNTMYVVSLTSKNGDFSDLFNKLDLADGDLPYSVSRTDNYDPPSLYMTVTKLAMVESVLIHKWSKEFPFDESEEIPYLSIGGAIVNNDYSYLAVVGSTSGIGPGYGLASGTDEDGFVTLLDLRTGEASTHVEKNEIREGSSADDIVTGICQDESDQSAFYIVGGTRGVIGTEMSESSTYPIPDGSLQAFLRKIDANTLKPLWTIQFGSATTDGTDPTMMYALDCSVIPGQGLMYVGGVVHNGTGVVQGENLLESSGGDDLWIGQIDVVDGSVQWLEQVGSSGDDRMAPHSGLVTTSNGNAVLFGDTNGSFARTRSQSDVRDLMLMTFDIDGGLVKASSTATATPAAPPVLSPVFNDAMDAATDTPTEAPLASPVSSPATTTEILTDAPVAPVVAPTSVPVVVPTLPPVPIAPTTFAAQPAALAGEDAGAGESVWSDSNTNTNSNEQEMVGLVIGLILGFGLFAGGLAYYYYCVYKKKRAKKRMDRYDEQIQLALDNPNHQGGDGIFARFKDDPGLDGGSYPDDYSDGSAEKRFSDLRPAETHLI
jgi:hypothetical protein